MLLDANIFQPLINILADVLKFFHNTVGVSWGVSIVLLTVALRLALVPLALKQFHSMQRLQMHMPELKALQAKYKDNRERLNQETMKFYSENNVNPFASCVPLLIQWPFLIAMFWTLRGNLRNDICPGFQEKFRHTFAAQHHTTLAHAAGQTTACGSHGGAGFLFIHDLTNKATGAEMVLLLVLYIGTSLGSSMIMMAPGTEKNQRYMMMALPVLFSLFVIQFPAGALLYYILFNLWMIGQQVVFKELVGHQYRVPPGQVATPNVGAGTARKDQDGQPKKGLFARMAENAAAAQAAQKDGQDRPAAVPSRAGRGAGPGRGAGAGSADKSAKPAQGKPAGGSGGRSGPPPPPRKKKKRSGRRR